ncbi:MAG TPA: bifunctional phosphoglucose/phosphomannose isomerase [Actinomycetota bacterium]
MIDLDDEVAVRAADPAGMLDVVAALPTHCREGYELGRNASPMPSNEGIGAIAFCGMGGSAVAGDMIAALGADRLALPVVVVRGGRLPAHCGASTLVVVSSYSGNTSETLACLEDATRRGCRVAAVTSGGRLLERAPVEGSPVVRVPAGFMPRAALGYLTMGPLGLLEAMGFEIGAGSDLAAAAEQLETLAATLVPSVPSSVNPAKRLARAVGNRVPVIWGAAGIGAVAAARWRTQMNENAKAPAWSAELPELDHNEVVGWSEGQGSRFFLIALRHEAEPRDVAVRFPVSMQIARDAGAQAEEVWAADGTPLDRLLSLVMIGDFASVYLGIARGFDPTPIDAIARLKQALAEA